MLLSRVAETVYWLGRYVERAENTARLVLVNANLMLDLPKGIPLGWEPVLNITGGTDLFYEHYSEPSERNVLKFLISDRHNPSSIISSLNQARENLRTTRVLTPRAAWESLNDVYLYAKDHLSSGITRRGRHQFLHYIIESSQKLTGILSATMSHDKAYTFIRMGRNLERADMTTRVIDVRAGNLIPERVEDLKPFEDIQWMSVLNSLAAYQMYRRHVHMRVRRQDVLRFLLQDVEFPRSVLHCLGEVVSCLNQLSRNDNPLRTLGFAQRHIREVDVQKLMGSRLNAFVDEFQVVLGRLHEQIADTYFGGEAPAVPQTEESKSKPNVAAS